MFSSLRPRFDFWLDLRKPEEEEIAYQIVELKERRAFVDTVRKGIRLMISLVLGRTDVLEELFPLIVERLREEGRAEAEGRGSQAQARLQAQIDRLEGLLVAQWRSGGQVAVADDEAKPLLVSGNLKSLAGSSKPLPGPDGHDDLADLLEVKDVSSEGGGIASQNLINSMLAMQSVKSDKSAKPSKSVKLKRQPLDDLLEVKTVGSG
jgi:hypothetical protein